MTFWLKCAIVPVMRDIPQLPLLRVPVADVLCLLDAATRVGANADQILCAGGCPWTFSELSGRAAETLPQPIFAAIYKEAMLGIEAAGADAGLHKPITPEHYAMMWRSTINCATLGMVIDRIIEFSEMLDGRMGAPGLTLEGEHVVFVLDPLRSRRSPSSFVSELIGTTMFVRMFSWLIGEDIPLREIEFDYPASYAEFVIEGMHDHPIRLEAPVIAMQFPAVFLERANIRNAEELEALLPLSTLSVPTQPKTGRITGRVLHHLDQAILSDGPVPDMVRLSRMLNLSVATLRRRLAEEGTSLRQLKQVRRAAWACELLGRPDLTISDLASRVGFSDETAFRRAFKEWTEKSPAAFRKSLLSAGPIESELSDRSAQEWRQPSS